MKVRCCVATQSEFVEYVSRDVSLGGTFVETATPFKPGTLVRLELKFAAEQHPVHGVGRVVWIREALEANGSGPPGMGIKFVKIDGISRRAIERLA